jgi:hypothetical protein
MKEIRIPILNNEYKVVVCWGNPSQIAKVLQAYHYDDADLIYVSKALENRRGVTFRRDRCFPVIALPKRPKTPEEIGSLAHEACHAIKEIFDFIQEKEIDEVFAHSVGAVVRAVLGKPTKEKK